MSKSHLHISPQALLPSLTWNLIVAVSRLLLYQRLLSDLGLPLYEVRGSRPLPFALLLHSLGSLLEEGLLSQRLLICRDSEETVFVILEDG